jgi:23S rRNA (adenine2503-C2)-methyltransferase
METPKTALLGRTLDEIQQIVRNLGMPKFAAKQITSWLYDKKVETIDEMTNLSLKHREALKEGYEVGASAPVEEMRSVDGTVKYLFRTPAHNFIEAVYIPDEDRATLCVSSQVGCKMNCKFCMTGKQGFTANLSAHQILNQIYSIPEREKLTNLVFMGMGEPFDNLDEVLKVLEILTSEYGYGWSPKTRPVAMNPVDHPMGGGEGRSSGGHPRSRKGLPAKGYRTRAKANPSNKYIVERRKK